VWNIRTVVHGDDFLSEGTGESLEAMDQELRKSFALKTEILGGGPKDVRSLKVVNRQISWKEGEIHWEADPRHVEILAQQLGMESSSSVKTPGDKNDADKTFRFRDLDGEGESYCEESASFVDELYRRSCASPGRIPTSPLTRKDDPKLAQWADADADDDRVPDMSTKMESSRESRRRATLGADGWLEGQDGLWRKSFENAEWMPKCEVGHVTHAVVRDQATGVAIHDSAGATHFDNGRLTRAFRVPRSVDMIVEVNLA
jgi:hypothetical protein